MTDVTEAGHPGETHLLDVAFLDLNTNETARFAVPGDLELQRAWDMAYDELGEGRREPTSWSLAPGSRSPATWTRPSGTSRSTSCTT